MAPQFMLIDAALLASSMPFAACGVYLATLAALSRSLRVAPYPSPRTKFEVIVPAHNEELGIGATVES